MNKIDSKSSAEDRLAALERRVQAVEDYHAIQNLMARYLNGSDGGWDRESHDGNVVAPMFTEDGWWEATGVDRAVGQKAIKDLWDVFRKTTPFSFHSISNPRIEVNGDTAFGEWHLVAFVNSTIQLNGVRDKAIPQFTAGIYTNHFVRTKDGWKFKSIHTRPAFFEPFTKGWGEAPGLAR